MDKWRGAAYSRGVYGFRGLNMRKALCGAVVVCVAIVGFASAAGAASQQQTSVQAKVATKAGAAAYLRSLGLDPASVVIQRGARNYAGPRCPGAGWNCTTSYRVFQISTSSAGGNEFSCTPPAAGTQSPDKCVIVQTATTANNVAVCKLARSASNVTVTQECRVTQTNSSGQNRLELKEELTLSGATTSVTQKAIVSQTNNSGANIVAATQRSTESMTATASSIGSWSQSVSQDMDIDQTMIGGATGTNSIDASQLVSQTQTAANATGGNQSQSSDQKASLDQFSHGVSTLKIKQSETQSQTAATTGVTQTQVGPQGCCSSQGDNPADTATVKQESKQTQAPGNNQTQVKNVTYTSAGNVSGSQTSTQDGNTSTNSFSGSSVSQEQSCTDGTCTAGPPAPPPAPANWTLFTWFGGDNTTVDGSPFPVSGAGPVVMSVTDIACKGDTFRLSEGTTLGTTSTVPEAASCSSPNPGDTNDPATAFNDPTYSHGTFALTAGSHSIDIVAANSPFGQGGAYYSVDPMTTAHCTGGAWATFTYPTFTSEANCLAFVGA